MKDSVENVVHSSEEPIRLGPFELTDTIGRGGMGEVWRARHLATGTDCAVKIIISSSAGEAQYRRALKREVESAARLHHPHIVTLYDYGVASEETARRSDGVIRIDTPWYAMEVAQGQLGETDTVTNWEELYAVLLAILDGLAHAHARGIIHRDLKPENVLLVGDERRPKLSDFGIAQALRPVDPEDDKQLVVSAAGTPGFMAPEQITGNWRDVGPWTDLYSFGCLVHTLVTGFPPFMASSAVETLTRHLHDDPPGLTPRFPIPHGLTRWTHRLLAKNAAERYRRCADAAFALQQLDESTETNGFQIPPHWDEDAASITGEEVTEAADDVAAFNHIARSPMSTTSHSTLSTDLFNQFSTRVPTLDTKPILLTPSEQPPFPQTWSDASSDDETSTQLVGLGLYGMREIPFIDRIGERSEIWELLRTVSEKRTPRALLIRGDEGTGKTRLAEWIAERAHELGAADFIEATHDRNSPPLEGIRTMLSSRLQADGLDRARTQQRALKLLEQRCAGGHTVPTAATLTEFLRPAKPEEEEAPLARFDGNDELFEAIGRFIRCLTWKRPLVVVLDDAHRDVEAIRLADYLLDTLEEMPVLLVVVVRDDELAEETDTSRAVRRLRHHRRAKEMRIRPLSRDVQIDFVNGVLNLQLPLARKVVARSEGNPMFAIQLVGDWVRRGVLNATEAGFTLEDESPDLPDGIHELWMQRLDEVCREFDDPDGVRQTLQLASVLGARVYPEELARACRNYGSPLPDDLVEALSERRLVSHHLEHWTFVHGMLRESLLRAAREEGGLSAMHEACAQMLAESYPRANVAISERITSHRLASGAHEESLDLLEETAQNCLGTGEFQRARRLLDQHRHKVRELELPEDDEHRLTGMAIRASLLRDMGRFEDGDALALQVSELARESDLTELEARGTWTRAECALRTGRLEDAREHFNRALDLAETTGDTTLQMKIWQGLSALHTAQGRPYEGRQAALKGIDLARAANDPLREAWCTYQLAGSHRMEGRIERAKELLEKTRPLFQRGHSREGLAASTHELAEVARDAGRLEEAERGYRTALALLRTIGSHELDTAQLNLVLTRIQRGACDDVLGKLREFSETFEEEDRRLHLALAQLGIACCEATLRHAVAFDAAMDRVEQLLSDSGLSQPQIGSLARLAADAWRDAGDEDRRARASRLQRAHSRDD